MTFTFRGISYSFKVFESGRVVDMEGNEVCVTGGEQCLTSYWNSWTIENEFTTVTVSINGVQYEFTIYGNGAVSSADGEVICEVGG